MILKNIQKLHIIATKVLSLTMPKLSPKVNLSLMNMIVSIKVETKDKFENKFNEEKFNANESFELSSVPPKKCLIPFVIGIGSHD